jgi:predicted RNA polymerase sigma factor
MVTIWPTARADMQRRLGLAEAARASYQRALELTGQPAERRFLQARLAQLAGERTKGRRLGQQRVGCAI